ncbi:hypothetical protein KKE06_05960 [Candidatus Micrarchaeota archaeon]|nr:hypothetical protein [Candidatus Micrarchaeota archaeon]MBU1930460.1 hypothetical protein [Candidatus Micrarchaeota archaeon]
MRFAIVFALLLCLAWSTLADVGPSPSYSFAVVNAPAYPDYTFFYLGNIMGGEIDGETPVYKLDTMITVYAIPKDSMPDSINPNAISQEVLSQSIASQVIDLGPGTTLFEIAGFDETTKTMMLSIGAHEPPNPPGFAEPLLDPIVLVGIVVILIIIIGGAYWASKRGKKQ